VGSRDAKGELCQNQHDESRHGGEGDVLFEGGHSALIHREHPFFNNLTG